MASYAYCIVLYPPIYNSVRTPVIVPFIVRFGRYHSMSKSQTQLSLSGTLVCVIMIFYCTTRTYAFQILPLVYPIAHVLTVLGGLVHQVCDVRIQMVFSRLLSQTTAKFV